MLREIAAVRPKDKVALATFSGIGESKLVRFDEGVLEIVAAAYGGTLAVPPNAVAFRSTVAVPSAVVQGGTASVPPYALRADRLPLLIALSNRKTRSLLKVLQAKH